MPKLKDGVLTKKEIISELVFTVGGTQSLWNICPSNTLRQIHEEVKSGNTAGVAFALKMLEEEKKTRKELNHKVSTLQSHQKALIQQISEDQIAIKEIKDLHNESLKGIETIVKIAEEAINNPIDEQEDNNEDKEDFNFFMNTLSSLRKIVTLGFF